MKIRIADIMDNDVVDGVDVCVSLWTQGCPFHCFNCHNEQTWDFDKGTEVDVDELVSSIVNKININGIIRNFSVLGGEPLCKENIHQVAYIIHKVREYYPYIIIFVWTGNTYESLMNNYNDDIKSIFNDIDILIDGQYVDSLRNITLFLRGSTNQRVINIKEMRNTNSFDNIILVEGKTI